MRADRKLGGPSTAKGEITRLLIRWSEGDMQALDQVFPLAFQDLRHIARKCYSEIPCKDLQATELIGEIYSVLLRQKKVSWEGRAQFYRFAALLMERVLLGYKRGFATQKRGAGIPSVPLIEALDIATPGGATSLADPADPGHRQTAVVEAVGTAMDVAEKIERLEKLEPEQAEIARLRYMIGLTVEETAKVVGISSKTVKRRWKNAKRFLAAELEEYEPG